MPPEPRGAVRQQQQPLAWQQQLAGKVKRRGAAPPWLGFPLAPELHPPRITPDFDPREERRYAGKREDAFIALAWLIPLITSLFFFSKFGLVPCLSL